MGAVIALACGRQVKESRSALFNLYFLGAMLFEILFFLPFGIYLYYFYTDWSWMYFFDPSRLAPRTVNILGLAAMAAYLGSLIVGFQMAQFLIRNNLEKTARLILVVAVAGLGIFSLLTLDRLMYIGSYPDYFAGQVVLLMRHKVGYLNTLVGLCMFGALVFMIRAFRKEPSARGAGRQA